MGESGIFVFSSIYKTWIIHIVIYSNCQLKNWRSCPTLYLWNWYSLLENVRELVAKIKEAIMEKSIKIYSLQRVEVPYNHVFS